MNFTQKQDSFLCSFLVLSLVFSGCVRYRPQASDRASFMARAQTQTQDNVTVTVSVLSNKESKRIFGVELAKRGVQPVWVQIDNQSLNSYYVFVPRNLDPNYYSAEEAAYMAHFKQSTLFLESGLLSVLFFPLALLIPINYFVVKRANNRMTSLFNKNSLPAVTVEPKTTESGFVFTSVDQGTKHVKVELIGRAGKKTFPFVITVPGIKPDYTTKDFANRYPEQKLIECTEEKIPEIFNKLPCCVTNKKGTENGDPFNLIVIGELEDIIATFTAAGWAETEALSFKSAMSMAKAFFTGETNRYSPISDLYHKGHSQDIAFQKARSNINQRLHLRLWYTPVRYNRRPVWIGTISRDIGVKFTFKTWYLTTHKIDPNLDDSRDYLLADLIEIQKVSKFGFIKSPALEKQTEKEKKNLTGDPYFSDNLLLTVELSKEDTGFSEFSWANSSG